MTNLREKRIEKGLSQKDLAAATGVKNVTMCAYEKGTRRPKPDKAKKIAAVLGFDWTEFYEDPEPAEAES